MIIPNLMVNDMPRAIAFYRDVVGLNVTMMISGDRDTITPVKRTAPLSSD